MLGKLGVLSGKRGVEVVLGKLRSSGKLLMKYLGIIGEIEVAREMGYCKGNGVSLLL